MSENETKNILETSGSYTHRMKIQNFDFDVIL